MDKASETLYALKPVTFKHNSDKQDRTQFGLIAEEVAEVNPNLTLRDNNGRIASVRYEQVNAMLLNEFLKRAQESRGTAGDHCRVEVNGRAAAKRDRGSHGAAQRAGLANPESECPA
jgi:hypothetical protein